MKMVRTEPQMPHSDNKGSYYGHAVRYKSETYDVNWMSPDRKIHVFHPETYNIISLKKIPIKKPLYLYNNGFCYGDTGDHDGVLTHAYVFAELYHLTRSLHHYLEGLNDEDNLKHTYADMVTHSICVELINNLHIKPSDDEETRMEPLRELCKRLWPRNGELGMIRCLDDAIVRLETFGVDEKARADVKYLMKAVMDGIAEETWREHLKNAEPPVF